MSREVHYGSGDQSKTVVSTNSDIGHGGTRITTFDEYGKQTSETHVTPSGDVHSHDSSGATKR